jgi:hypothetical protein
MLDLRLKIQPPSVPPGSAPISGNFSTQDIPATGFIVFLPEPLKQESPSDDDPEVIISTISTTASRIHEQALRCGDGTVWQRP